MPRPEAAPSGSAGQVSGDLLDRCTLAVREEGGSVLGSGILVGAKWVLTCAHVVRGLEQIEFLDGLSLERVAVGAVSDQDTSGGEDLALVELDLPLSERGKIRFEEGQRGDHFQAVGFPRGKRQIRGEVQGRFRNRLECDVDGSEVMQKGFSGSAVWVQGRGVAVGLIADYHPESGKAYAIPADQIRHCFPQLFPEPVKDPKEQCRRLIARVSRQLKSEEIFSAILDADPVGNWQDAAAHKPEALAGILCLETKPEDLVEGLCQAFCDLEAERGLDTADKIFEVLTQALPAAVLSHWPLEWPDSSARDVQIGLVNRVLVEFALAASEGAAASFHSQLGRSSANEPRAVHRIPKAGEFGPDPAGDEGTPEVAQDLMKRLALDPDINLQKPEDDFLNRLARYRPTRKDAPFVPVETLRDMKEVSLNSGVVWRDRILEILNQSLAMRSLDGRRYFYFIAEEDSSLMDGLRRSLPHLKIVTPAGKPEEIVETHTLLTRLRTVFRRRHHHEGSKS